MKTKILLILFTLLIAYPFYGQTPSKTKLAEDVILKYTDYSNFKNGINKQSIDSFKLLFEPSAKIIFDIPFINNSIKNDDIKRISKDDRQQSSIISVFGKTVSLDLYLETLKRETDEYHLVDLDSTIRITGKIDSVGRNYDTIIYEVEKRFKNTEWSVASKIKYLFYMRKTYYNMNIFYVGINDENTTETDIDITLVDGTLENKKENGYYLSNVAAKFRITFSEPINNYSVTDTSNSLGKIKLGRAANKNSYIILDTVSNINGIRYNIPPDWKGVGKRVNEQPIDGFLIALRPYKWNGFAYSLSVSGGGFIPESMNLSNFQSGTTFNNKMGYKLGLNFGFTYFFNHTQWKTNSKKWLFGVGTGISIDYQKSSITSNGFSQNTYEYLDSKADTCQVLFKGQAYHENDELFTTTIPFYIELKKKIGQKSSFSLQAGVNVSLPVSGNYEASGNFSRWGYYNDLNSQPITNDEVYNYFTDSIINFNGNIEYNTVLAESFFKLKGYFNVFKKNPDNSLEIGLAFSLPFTASTNYSYPSSKVQDYNGYWINSGDNIYHSVAYSTEKLYKYYFGISIGINLVRYKSQ